MLAEEGRSCAEQNAAQRRASSFRISASISAPLCPHHRCSSPASSCWNLHFCVRISPSEAFQLLCVQCGLEVLARHVPWGAPCSLLTDGICVKAPTFLLLLWEDNSDTTVGLPSMTKPQLPHGSSPHVQTASFLPLFHAVIPQMQHCVWNFGFASCRELTTVIDGLRECLAFGSQGSRLQVSLLVLPSSSNPSSPFAGGAVCSLQLPISSISFPSPALTLVTTGYNFQWVPKEALKH